MLPLPVTAAAKGSEVEMDTFLVQVWVPADRASALENDLRGVVRHVASGVETPFSGNDQILALLRQASRHGSLTDREKENGK